MPSAAEVITKMVAEIGVDDTELNQGIIRVNGAMKQLEGGSLTKIKPEINTAPAFTSLRHLSSGIHAMAAGAKGDFAGMAMGLTNVARGLDAVKVASIAGAFSIGYMIGTQLDEWIGISDKVAKALNSKEDGKRSPQVEAMRKARQAEEMRFTEAQKNVIEQMGFDPSKSFSEKEMKTIQDRLNLLHIPLSGYGFDPKKLTSDEERTKRLEERSEEEKKQQDILTEKAQKEEAERLKDIAFQKQLAEFNNSKLSITQQISAIEKEIADANQEDYLTGIKKIENLELQRTTLEKQKADLLWSRDMEQARKEIADQRSKLSTISFGTASSLNREATQRAFNEQGKKLDAQEKALADKEFAKRQETTNLLLKSIDDKTGRGYSVT